MQKYIKNDFSEIRYFEDDVNVSDWIDLNEFRVMTADEILQNETLKSSQFHTVWDATLKQWGDVRSPSEIAAYNRSQMPTLTPIEFDLKLNNAGLYDTVQELIKDSFELRIAYNRATFFSRTAPFIDQARIALNLTDEQVDEMWTS
jgi:hypothetical protein